MKDTYYTRRRFLTTGAMAAGALGLSQIPFVSRIFAAQQTALKVNVTARCIFNSVVVTNEDQKFLPNPYKGETGYNFSMNDNCAGINQGIMAVRSGKADVGTLLRHLTPKEKASGLKETGLDRLAYSVIVNKKNPVNELTVEQALKIFAGRIQNWKEVGGKDLDILIYRQKCGASYDYILDQALAKAGIKKDTDRLNRAVMSVEITDNQLEKISVHEMTVSMVPRFFFDDNSKNLKIGGVLPSRASEKDGSYPFLADVSLVSRTNPSNAAKKYLAFINGPHYKKLIENGFAMNWLKDGF